MEIANVLKELMVRAGDGGEPMSQHSLANATGVPQPTISRILSGKHAKPYLQNVLDLCQYFHVTVEQMIGAEPLDRPQDEADLIRAYRALSDEDRALLRSMAASLANKSR